MMVVFYSLQQCAMEDTFKLCLLKPLTFLALSRMGVIDRHHSNISSIAVNAMDDRQHHLESKL